MQIIQLLPFLMICLANSTVYPGKRWLTICNNSMKWAHNRTSTLKTYLQDNLDVLYL